MEKGDVKGDMRKGDEKERVEMEKESKGTIRTTLP